MRLEIHAWPPHGQQFGKRRGALAIDLDTGLAVFVNSEGDPPRNQRLAEERLRAALAGSWP